MYIRLLLFQIRSSRSAAHFRTRGDDVLAKFLESGAYAQRVSLIFLKYESFVYLLKILLRHVNLNGVIAKVYGTLKVVLMVKTLWLIGSAACYRGKMIQTDLASYLAATT